jgi:hypothetical protein
MRICSAGQISFCGELSEVFAEVSNMEIHQGSNPSDLNY